MPVLSVVTAAPCQHQRLTASVLVHTESAEYRRKSLALSTSLQIVSDRNGTYIDSTSFACRIFSYNFLCLGLLADLEASIIIIESRHGNEETYVCCTITVYGMRSAASAWAIRSSWGFLRLSIFPTYSTHPTTRYLGFEHTEKLDSMERHGGI